MKNIRPYILGIITAIGSVVLIVFCAFMFFSTRLIAKHIAYIESTLQMQQKSITALNTIPANQSSLASANPGYITIQATIGKDDAVLGNANAPVTVVEFADFQCPFCEKFFKDSEPDIISNYVDTGKVRFVFENFAFLGDESTLSAEADACANAQGQFWPYHDYLYSHQSPENSGTLTLSSLEKIAGTISGINQDMFNDCLSSGKEKAFIQQQLSTAASEGISSTPTILVNGKEYVGVYDTATYETAIDNALNAK